MNLFVYLFFASISLTQMTILGHIYIVEISSCLLLISFPMFKNKIKPRLFAIDVVVFGFIFFNLISVAVNTEHLYSSARYYRMNTLLPGIVYFMIRTVPVDLTVIRRGFYFLSSTSLLQAIIYLYVFAIEGGRPSGVEGLISSTITLSFLFAMGACFLFYEFLSSRSIFMKIILSLAMLVLISALIASATRAVIVGVFILLPIGLKIFKSRLVKKIMSKIVIVGICIILGLIVFNFSINEKVSLRHSEKKLIQSTSERIISPELYILDINQRLLFWNRIADYALQKPWIGHGASSYSVGKTGMTSFDLGSSHNILISALLVQGLPGVLLLILMLSRTFACLNESSLPADDAVSLGPTLYILFIILIGVGITNDFSGGRNIIFFFIMGLSAKFCLISKTQG